MDAPDLTIIIPTLNAEAELRDLLAQAGAAYKIIISDGGSKDGTLTVGINSGTQIAMGSAGRGGQLARGAAWAIETGGVDWLLILHADVRLDENWQDALALHIKNHPGAAGFFKFAVEGRGFWRRWLSFWTNVRVSLFNLPYGDQGLLISRKLYAEIGGYPDWVLFEDVAIVKAIKKTAKLRAMDAKIYTNPARYQKGGFIRRPLANLWLLIRFLWGADPAKLAKVYSK